MIKAVNDKTGLTQDLMSTGDGALRVDPSGSKYQDMGLIIDASSIPAGSTVYSEWFDSVSWVRNTVIMAQCDASHSIYSATRDSSGNGNWSNSLAAGQAATSLWRTFRFASAQATSGALLGYGVRFGIKNDSGDIASYARLRVQLMGA